jgi:DNA-binding IclR family transcriptional regulator
MGTDAALHNRATRPTTALRDSDGGRPERFSTSLCAGLSILTSFTAERPVRGIADVADDLGMGRSTIHRYATTLTALGYLEQGASRKYRLAARGADIGFALLHSMTLRRCAREHLLALRARTGHTVALAVLADEEVLCVDQLRGHRRGQYAIDLGVGIGTRAPAPRSAAGMALLGAEGVAVEDEQLCAGRRALAVALCDREGTRVAAIEVAVPAETCSRGDLLEQLAPSLQAAAGHIERELREHSESRRERRASRRAPRLPGEPLRAGR